MGRFRDYSAPGVGAELEGMFWELAERVTDIAAERGVRTRPQARATLEYARRHDDPSGIVALEGLLKERQNVILSGAQQHTNEQTVE